MECKIIGTGYTFPYKNKEVFITTNTKKITDNFCKKICKALFLPDHPDIIKELKYYLQKAICETRYSSKWFKNFYTIKGNGFSYCNYEKEDIIFITI